MDAEVAFLIANQAQAMPGKLVYDPFVGTGSILVAAAHFGAMTMVCHHTFSFGFNILTFYFDTRWQSMARSHNIG